MQRPTPLAVCTSTIQGRQAKEVESASSDWSYQVLSAISVGQEDSEPRESLTDTPKTLLSPWYIWKYTIFRMAVGPSRCNTLCFLLLVLVPSIPMKVRGWTLEK